MANEFEKQIEQYFPGNIREKTNIKEFREGITDLLVNFRDNINEFKYFLDPTLVGDDHLGHLGSQLNLNFPKGVSEQKRRIQIRDAVFSYRSGGTERSLKRIFKLIGWDVNVDYCWVKNPTSTDITPPIGPGVVIFGNEFISLVDGKLYVNLYDDFGNTYSNKTIYGENYSSGVPGTMIRIPYIRLTVNNTDYGNLTQDYVDPTTGVSYSYTESEEFKIIEETIRFLLDEGRPANIVIYDLVTFEFVEDHITFPAKDDTTTAVPEKKIAYDGSFVYGVEIDPYNFGEFYDIQVYGDTAQRITTPPVRIVERYYSVGSVGVMDYVPVRYDVDLRVELSNETLLNIEWTNSDRQSIANGTATWYNLIQISGILVGGIYLTNLKYARAVRLNILTPSTTTQTYLKVTQL